MKPTIMALVRGVKRLVAIGLLLVPMHGQAAPLLTGDPQGLSIYGWSNSYGNFAFDRTSAARFTTGGQASYSTTSSLFSLSGYNGFVGFWNPATSSGLNISADLEMNVLVQETGTVSGDLLGGVFTVVAGADGVPEANIAPGETLIVGYAIEAAALDHPFNVTFLLALTYTHEAFSSLGEYVTYLGPYAGAWGGSVGMSYPFEPWGRDWGPYGGFTFDSFWATRKVIEPPVVALLGLSLAGLAFTRRRKH